MGRSILAVVAGFIVTGALIVGTTAGVTAAFPGAFDARGVPTSMGMLLFMHLYVAVYATFGCWLAARLAPSRPMLHAMIVGALGIAVNAANPAIWDMYPWWSNVISLAGPILFARIAGTIREGQLARASGTTMATA
jgi:hypothetical protein